MKQINIHVTKGFLEELRTLMKLKGIQTKSEAIRVAVRELVKNLSERPRAQYRHWLGLGMKSPLKAEPRFKSEDSLWEK